MRGSTGDAVLVEQHPERPPVKTPSEVVGGKEGEIELAAGVVHEPSGIAVAVLETFDHQDFAQPLPPGLVFE